MALVTGSSGFIGRHFAAHLKDQGWDVFGIDIVPGEHTDAMADARDFFRSLGLFRGGVSFAGGTDLVIHAAAVVGGRAKIEGSPLDLAVNLELDAALFRWARVVRPGRVVYFSSSAAYPVSLQQPQLRHRLAESDISLDEPGLPDALYGWAKLTGEHLARLARADGLAVTVVRPFSGYGPDQDGAYPFPAFADRALRREDPFLVWGDGSQVRDWVHVDDIVAAVTEMYRLDHNGPLNIGWGAPVSLRELAGRVCAAAGYQPALETVPAAPAGVSWRVCDPVRLWQVCRPRVPLDQGIAGVLEYRKRYLT